MSIDADDVKVLVRRTLQYAINSCRHYVRDHPWISCTLLFAFLLYIFLPSLFNVLFYTSPLAIVAVIFLGGRFRYRSIRQDDDVIVHVTSNQVATVSKNGEWSKARCSIMKDEKKGKGAEGSPSKSTSKNDLINRSPMREMPMKIRGVKNEKRVSDHSESSQPYGRIPNSEHSKLIYDLSESDTECQEDDDDDEPQEETNKVVQWTEDDQRNLMDLGTSELERNRRLESLIAKRRARKLLSMQPIRGHLDLDDYDKQGPVVSVVAARTVEDAEGQPGSAPSVLLPTRNPFDLPYDPSEEKPILTGGSFEEEIFNAHQKDFSFCRHESFVRGPGLIGDINDDPIARSLPSFFPKPRASDVFGYSRFRRPSDMEENESLLSENLSHEGHLTDSQNDSHDQADKSSPKEEDQGKLADSGLSHLDIPLLKTNGAECYSDQLDKMEIHLVETKKSKTAETENLEKKDRSIDMEVSVTGIDEAGDEVSSSSGASEDVINVSKNEAFRNSVRKVLTCLIPRKRSYSNEKIGLRIEPHYDFSPNGNHPAKMEERSFYTGKPFHTPTYSIASDMLVEVSEAGSPSFNVEANSPVDRESLIYDADVEKDVNSGDEDLWGASPYPVRSEEYGSRFQANETGELGKSPLGLTAFSLHDPLVLPGEPETASNHTTNGESSSSSARPLLLKESESGLYNSDKPISSENRQVIAHGQDLGSPVPSSFAHIVKIQTLYTDNLGPLPLSDVASYAPEEQKQKELEKVIKQEATTGEALNLPDENHHSINLSQQNAVIYDESPGKEDDTEDIDSNARRSPRKSISPSMQPVSMVEQVPIILSSSPDSKLQETVTMDAAAPTNSEQNPYNDSRHPEDVVLNSHELLNNPHQESHTALEEGKHLEVLTKPSSLSSDSVSSEILIMNKVASTSSEANMHNDGHRHDKVTVKHEDLLNGPQQEIPSGLPEGKLPERLSKPPSPTGHSVLPSTVTMDEVSSTCSEESTHNDRRQTDEIDERINELVLDLPQESYNDPEKNHLERLSESPSTTGNLLLSRTAAVDEVSSTSSMPNMHTESRDIGQVLMRKEMMNDLQQDNVSAREEEMHLEGLSTPLSPSVHIEASKEQLTTPHDKAATASNPNLKEHTVVEGEEGKSIENVKDGHSSSSDQHLTHSPVVPVQETRDEWDDRMHEAIHEQLSASSREDHPTVHEISTALEKLELSADDAFHGGNESYVVNERENKEIIRPEGRYDEPPEEKRQDMNWPENTEAEANHTSDEKESTTPNETKNQEKLDNNGEIEPQSEMGLEIPYGESKRNQTDDKEEKLIPEEVRPDALQSAETRHEVVTEPYLTSGEALRSIEAPEGSSQTQTEEAHGVLQQHEALN